MMNNNINLPRVYPDAVTKWVYGPEGPIKFLVKPYTDDLKINWYIPIGTAEETGWFLMEEAFETKFGCLQNRRDELMLIAENIASELDTINSVLCSEEF